MTYNEGRNGLPTARLSFLSDLHYSFSWLLRFVKEKEARKVELIHGYSNYCRGFDNLSYIIHLRQEYIFAPMDQEILKVFFYDVRCAVVMYFSAWSAIY